MITLKVKHLFFDRAVVINAMDKQTRRALIKAGSFVRTAARSAIGRRVTSNTPPRPEGSAPRLRTRGSRNIKRIFFAYDPIHKSVVVGPEIFDAPHHENQPEPVGQNVTEVMEHGGPVKITEHSFDQIKWRMIHRQRTARERSEHRSRIITYRPRPFMGPALEQEVRLGNVVGPFMGP